VQPASADFKTRILLQVQRQLQKHVSPCANSCSLASRHHEGVRGGAALSDDEVLQQVRPAGAMSSCADGDAISVLWRPALRHIAAALALRWTAAAQLCIHTTTSCRQCSSIPHAT